MHPSPKGGVSTVQSGSSCVGTDPNRNWGVEWCKSGASRDPCSDAYCGSSAFSEQETKAIADYVTANAASVGAFIDWHAYSQLWMAPWGYTKDLPSDRSLHKEAGEKAVAALKAIHGTTFREGTIANIIYEASGSSADWGYKTFGIIHSYGVELRDTGRYGFLLPPEQIIPSGEETVEALISMGQTVIDM